MKTCLFLYVFVLIACVVEGNAENVVPSEGNEILKNDTIMTKTTPKPVIIKQISTTRSTTVRPATTRASTIRPATTTHPITTNHHTTNRPLIPGLKFPCSCIDGQCGCCTGAVLDRLRQKICANFTYEPDDFALSAMMTMNGRILYRNTFSGKNPPPACVRVPRMNFIRLCVQFSNIFFASRNIHLCIDMAANWESVTLVHWSFDCIRMGAAGVAVVPPEAGGGLPPSPIDTEGQVEEDYDDSARNVPKFGNLKSSLKASCADDDFNDVIFDASLSKLAAQKADEKLISIKKLLNTCDVVVAYNKNANTTIY